MSWSGRGGGIVDQRMLQIINILTCLSFLHLTIIALIHKMTNGQDSNRDFQVVRRPLYHPVILSFYSFWKMDVRKRHTRQPKSGTRGDADRVNPLTFCKPCVAEDHKINLIGQTTLKCWRVQFETNKFLHSMRWSLQMGMWSSSPPPFRIPLIHHSEKNCSD